MNKLPQPLKATISFVIASTITQGLTLLSTPLFVRIMSPEEMGIVTNFNSWSVLLGIVINMVLYANSYVIAINEYPNQKYEYTSCALFVSMFSAIIFLLLYKAFPLVFENAFHLNTRLMYLMCIGFIFLPATNFWLTLQRYEYKYVSVLIVSVVSAFLGIGLSIGAVLYAGKSGTSAAEARLFGTYLVNVAIGIVFTIYLFGKGKKIWNKEFYKFIIVVNTPMIIHSLAKNILDVSDRVMIASLVGNAEAGIYGTLYSISTLIMILWNAINMGITPYMFSQLNEIDKCKESLKAFINILLEAFFIFSIVFVLVSPEIIKLFTSADYVKAINIVPPIISGCFITAVYSLMGNILLYNKKTTSVMKATVIAGLVNVFLNRILIPVFGYHAAAYTTIAGYIVLCFVLYLSIRKINNKTSDFFDFKFAFIIITSNLILSGIIIILYPYPLVRYSIVIAVFLLAIYKRHILFQIVKKLKK